ncbi:AAEL007577-PA [Aedes aegypti]|uniref:AAEL007577-PA n=1 Tax=Aedes aegypti TaxID=7159 RepID=Q171P4_AEDAE|nr:AAEL007577-PA [Aedes aegypti]
MWTYMMAAARGDRAMSSISQRHQSSRNDFDSPSIYHFNRVQRPLYNTTHRAPALCNGPSTISTTPFGSNTIYQNFNPSTAGSFSSVATTPSLSTTTTPAPVSGPGGSASTPTAQQPALAFTTRNRIEVASEQGSMPNSNSKNSKNNHLSQPVIECERDDFLGNFNTF